jgi:hypothetical protein
MNPPKQLAAQHSKSLSIFLNIHPNPSKQSKIKRNSSRTKEAKKRIKFNQTAGKQQQQDNK